LAPLCINCNVLIIFVNTFDEVSNSLGQCYLSNTLKTKYINQSCSVFGLCGFSTRPLTHEQPNHMRFNFAAKLMGASVGLALSMSFDAVTETRGGLFALSCARGVEANVTTRLLRQ
jgi:hypothetical protein